MFPYAVAHQTDEDSESLPIYPNTPTYPNLNDRSVVPECVDHEYLYIIGLHLGAGFKRRMKPVCIKEWEKSCAPCMLSVWIHSGSHGTQGLRLCYAQKMLMHFPGSSRRPPASTPKPKNEVSPACTTSKLFTRNNGHTTHRSPEAEQPGARLRLRCSSCPIGQPVSCADAANCATRHVLCHPWCSF